jgi:glycerate 2-kinase
LTEGVPLKVLIIPDKFKGTLTAWQAAHSLARGWKSARPADELELLPMSDGGDGFGELVGERMGAIPQSVKTIDAAHRPREAAWWFHEPSKTAIIESARIVGLAQLPPGKYHPFELDTAGLGEVFLAAANRGARTCLVGIGGSATNDAGYGLAKAVGWQFFNFHDEPIERWTELHTLAQMRPPGQRLPFADVKVAVDVQNPLLGPRGCTRTYGPQKGLRADDFEFAERCLGQLAQLVARQLHLSCAEEPGAGAAGGLGYGLRCFLGGQLEPGFALFAETTRLPAQLAKADLVLTGEGAIDEQTVMGKGVGELANLCRRYQVPCLGFAGTVSDLRKALTVFVQTHALTPEYVSLEKAYARTAECLEGLAARAASEWTGSGKSQT